MASAVHMVRSVIKEKNPANDRRNGPGNSIDIKTKVVNQSQAQGRLFDLAGVPPGGGRLFIRPALVRGRVARPARTWQAARRECARTITISGTSTALVVAIALLMSSPAGRAAAAKPKPKSEAKRPRAPY